MKSGSNTSDLRRSADDRRLRRARLAIVVLLCVLQFGCVGRRLTIHSNPPGALVYIDGYEIGTTPVSTSFTYYGTRQIRLVKDRYETLTVDQKILPPWYQYPPVDFVTENVLPFKFQDERVLDFQMVPQQIVPTDQLLGRAENLRQVGHTQGATVIQPPNPTVVVPQQAAPPLVPPPG